MVVLIKDMEMPKNCLACKLRGDGSDSRYIWDCPFTGFEYTSEEGETGRLDDCPLVEVPAAQKKGHWIDEGTNYCCSECHRGCWVNSDYCPWCGAYMRGERNE